MKKFILLVFLLISSNINYTLSMKQEKKPEAGKQEIPTLVEKIVASLIKKDNLIKFLQDSKYRESMLKLPSDLKEKVVDLILKNNIPFKEKLLTHFMRIISQVLQDRDYIHSVSWDPDSKQIASAGGNTIRIWDLNTNELKHTLYGHERSVESVAWSPNGKLIASASRDQTIRIWNAEIAKLEHILKITTGGDHIFTSVDWSSDSNFIASASADNAIRIWDINEKKLKDIFDTDKSVRSVSWSPNNKMIAAGSSENAVLILDIETKKLTILTGHTGPVYSVTWSPDSQFVASGSYDNTIRIWDLKTGELKKILNGHTGLVYSVAWSHDTKYIASGSLDKTIRIWNGETGELKYTLSLHTSSILSVAWNHNDKYIASGSGDKTIRIWNIASLENYFSSINSLDMILLFMASHENIDNKIIESYLDSISKDQEIEKIELIKKVIDLFVQESKGKQ